MPSGILLFADIVGTIGVAFTLIAYLLLQLDKLDQDDTAYSVLNLIGALMVLYSLFYNWNTPAVIMEGAWLLISFYGLIKRFKQPR